MTKTAHDHDSIPGYLEPVRQLLQIGGETDRKREWLDYPATYGLRRDHVDDLIRMARDPALNMDDAGETAAWGPVHASRALGQLQAVEAIEPLLSTCGISIPST